MSTLAEVIGVRLLLQERQHDSLGVRLARRIERALRAAAPLTTTTTTSTSSIRSGHPMASAAAAANLRHGPSDASGSSRQLREGLVRSSVASEAHTLTVPPQESR